MTSFVLTVFRYDIGPPIFLGLVGCFLIFLGAVFYAVTVCQVIRPERYSNLSVIAAFSMTAYSTAGDDFFSFWFHSKVIYAYGGRTYMSPRTRGRSLYTGYYGLSRQYGSYMGSGRSSSSKLSKISQTTPTKISERDAFV